MVLGKKGGYLIGNGAEIQPLEMGRKGPGNDKALDKTRGVTISRK